MKKYGLARSVNACLSGGNLILLDLKKDKYFFVSQDELKIISPYIETDFPLEPDYAPKNLNDGTIPTCLQAMIEHGCIEATPGRGRPLQTCVIAPPVTPFEHLECDSPPNIKWHHILLAFFAGAYAYFRLKITSLWSIAQDIEQSKSGLKKNIFPTTTHDKAINIARIYKRLRPILPRSRICLYDSLAFFYFSKIYGVEPDIVFGIVSDPFQAHCWVQLNGYILNDVPQNICQYTPISVI